MTLDDRLREHLAAMAARRRGGAESADTGRGDLDRVRARARVLERRRVAARSASAALVVGAIAVGGVAALRASDGDDVPTSALAAPPTLASTTTTLAVTTTEGAASGDRGEVPPGLEERPEPTTTTAVVAAEQGATAEAPSGWVDALTSGLDGRPLAALRVEDDVVYVGVDESWYRLDETWAPQQLDADATPAAGSRAAADLVAGAGCGQPSVTVTLPDAEPIVVDVPGSIARREPLGQVAIGRDEERLLVAFVERRSFDRSCILGRPLADDEAFVVDGTGTAVVTGGDESVEIGLLDVVDRAVAGGGDGTAVVMVVRAGDTWTSTVVAGREVAANGARLAYVDGAGGVRVSGDLGDTWDAPDTAGVVSGLAVGAEGIAFVETDDTGAESVVVLAPDGVGRTSLREISGAPTGVRVIEPLGDGFVLGAEGPQGLAVFAWVPPDRGYREDGGHRPDAGHRDRPGSP